jgi:hypothetical protein
MTLTKQEIDLLKLLIEDKFDEIYSGPETLSNYWKPELLYTILTKLNNLDT